MIIIAVVTEFRMQITLDKTQKRAVEYNRGNLLLIAGPGAGKTRVIISRMHYLIENGVEPSRILAVTFTNKAADEIRDRIETSFPEGQTEPTVSTFHSFALRIIREFHEVAGLIKYFTVIDEAAQDEILSQALRTHRIVPSTVVLRRLRSHLDFEKARACYPLIHPNIQKDLIDDIYEVFKEYQQFLIDNDALDFNDLLLVALTILQGDEDARVKLRNRYDHILLDEFQDINLSQYQLMRFISRDDATVLAVADSDQMIYNWRGSDPGLMNAFLHDFNAEKMELDSNYRCPDAVIYATKQLISHNRKQSERKIRIPEKIDPRIALIEMPDDANAARAVAKIVLINLERGFKPGDFGIIYRMHGLADDIEQELLSHEVPLMRVRPKDDSLREGIDQLMSFLRLSRNLFDWDVKSAWDFPRRILNPLEGYRITSRAKKVGVSLFKMVESPKEQLNISLLAQNRLKRFTGLVEKLTILGEELSPSGYFARLRKNLNSFLSPFNPQEEEKLTEHLFTISNDWSSLIKRLIDNSNIPHILILHTGSIMLQLAALMIVRTLKDFLGITSQIALAHNISDQSWTTLTKNVSQGKELVIIHLGSSGKSELFLSEFWERGLSFEMFEITPPFKGELFFTPLACFRFLIDLLTRMPGSDDEKLVFYDLETTGIDTRRCEIIELSALSTQLYSDESETYNSLVAPDSPPPPEIQELTGITPKMLEDAVQPSRVINEFDAFSHGGVIIGHNIISFDNRIMERYYPVHLQQDFIPDSIDTVLWARELFPGKNNSLAALGERFGFETGNLHRAGEDVRLNRDVFYKLLEVDSIKRGLDFSANAIIYMALATLQRDEAEKGAGRAFLTAAIRLLANKEIDLTSIKNDLNRAFSTSTVNDLMKSIDALSKEAYPDDPVREKWVNLADNLAQSIMYYEDRSDVEGISGFVNYYTLLTESDMLQEGNTVKMMTIHAAKGLEFPIVIIVGLEQGSIPHYLALERLERIEEERRLLYVAMTRAREKIYLIYTRKRGGRYRPPSMFLQEISDKLVKKYRST